MRTGIGRYKGARAGALLLPAVALVALMGCVPVARDTAARDMAELKKVSFQSQKRIQDLETTAGSIRAELATLKAETMTLPSDEAVTAVRTSQTALYSQIQDLLTELQAVNGRLEELKFTTDKTQKQLGAEIELIKSRSESGPGPSGRTDPALASRLANIEADLTVLKGRISALETRIETAAPAAGASGKLSPDQQYDKGVEAFNQSRYAEARTIMREFLTRNPEHRLAGNAHFWIGESFYADRKYEDAILSYEEVIKKFPLNGKVPAALLKQAYAFAQIGDRKAATAILNDLIRSYPADPLAEKARAKLKELK
jgi:tol-pal system protein YbgF